MQGLALAVYPIANADFSLVEAPPLTEYNFASRKALQARIDSLDNYQHYVQMRFKDGTTAAANQLCTNVEPKRSTASRNQSQGVTAP